MSSLNQIYRGSPKPIGISVPLRAGKILAAFGNAELRNIMVGDVEIVRHIYMAVRTEIWNTVGYVLSDPQLESTEKSFHLEFECRHKNGPVDFRWHGCISGLENSTIKFSMKGKAFSSFQSNRIGFCVLHPLHECLGKPCEIVSTKGEKTKGRFPRFISPDPPFKNIRTIIQRTNGIESHIILNGDSFEMEDQRNWTDASFKTYCPPRSRPHPFLVRKGDEFSQTVEISIGGKPGSTRTTPKAPSSAVRVEWHSKSQPVPEIGCMFNSSQNAASLRHAKMLGLSHLRIDVAVSRSGIASALKRIKGVSTELDVPLEMALHFLERPLPDQIHFVLGMIVALGKPVRRFLVFRRKEKVTADATMRDVRPVLRRAALGSDVVTGTDSYFVEINKAPPDLKGIDGICYSVNPQVHTYDEQSILGSPEAQFYTVETARRIACGAPVYVTPITFRPRLNPELPKKFHGPDARQKSLFGAVWTLASIIRLAQAGARGATYFELSGPCGVMARDGKRVFPVFHVLADVNEFAGGTMRFLSLPNRSGITGCLLEKSGRRRWLIANMSLEAKTVMVSSPPKNLFVKHLDETTFEEGCNRPERFRLQKGTSMRAALSLLEIKLRPYAIARLDEKIR